MNLQDDTKYAIGRNPYHKTIKIDGMTKSDIEVIDWENLPEPLSNLEDTAISDIDGFKPLAWTGRIRHLYYNPEAELILNEIEGDLFLYKNPSKETIENLVQDYPMAEVSHGEKYDSRFN